MYIRCPYYKQSTNFSCGPTSVKMLLDFWENDQEYSEKALIKYLHAKPKVGVENEDVIKFFINYGYKIYYSTSGNSEMIEKFISLGLPIFINYKNLIFGGGHYSVIVGFDKNNFILNDPSYGDGYKVTKKAFLQNWSNSTGDIQNWFLVPIKEQYFRFYELGEFEKGFIGL